MICGFPCMVATWPFKLLWPLLTICTYWVFNCVKYLFYQLFKHTECLADTSHSEDLQCMHYMTTNWNSWTAARHTPTSTACTNYTVIEWFSASFNNQHLTQHGKLFVLCSQSIGLIKNNLSFTQQNLINTSKSKNIKCSSRKVTKLGKFLKLFKQPQSQLTTFICH